MVEVRCDASERRKADGGSVHWALAPHVLCEKAAAACAPGVSAAASASCCELPVICAAGTCSTWAAPRAFSRNGSWKRARRRSRSSS